MAGATKESGHMSREDAVAWRDSVLKSFEARLGSELPDRFANRFAGSENTLSIYSGALENISKDVWREIFIVARDPASKMGPVASKAAEKLDKCYSEIVDYAEGAVKTGNLKVLKDRGYQVLFDAGAVLAGVREEAAPYKASMRAEEPESVSTYIDMILSELERTHQRGH
ncbi:MAG: hypothetical protein LVQ95_00630 [Candidatus Micrarchaeales archaeon]|nr:hypothetical protein [Candidatus Micrarchaeales archaeon]